MKHFLSFFEKVTLSKWERPALSDYKGSDYTYAQVAARIKTIHLAYKNLNLNPGDKVAFLPCGHGPDTIRLHS
jgi:long-chain acyl-CoA synthetase